MTSTTTTARVAALFGAVTIGAGLLAVGQAGTANASTFPKATVHAEGGLISHDTPSRYGPRTYVFPDRAEVSVDCRVNGTSVDGNRHWYLIATEGSDGTWVSGRYLDVHGKAKPCLTQGIEASTVKSEAGLFRGPSKQDVRTGTLHRGDRVTVRCYTGQNLNEDPTHRRWVLTDKTNWVPASAIKAGKKIPYCSQTS